MSKNIEMELPLSLNESENCAFITTNLLELKTENFDDWLDENHVRYIIRNEASKDEMLNVDVDPLLNQCNANDSLDSLSDSETNLKSYVKTEFRTSFQTETQKCINENASIDSDTGWNKFPTYKCKCLYLNELVAKGMHVEFMTQENKVKLTFTDKESNVIPYPDLYIVKDGYGHIAIPTGKLEVRLLERNLVADDLEADMPALLLETNGRIFICPHTDCDEAYLKYTVARLHALKHIGHKPFKCDFEGCTWAFYSMFKLKRHKECHKNIKDYICSYEDCRKKFTNIYNLKVHINNHSRPATLSCPVPGCPQLFQTSRVRDRHFKTHDPSEAPFVCPEQNCNRAFFMLSGLSAHNRVHSYREEDLKCGFPNCGKVFDLPCRLKEHTRSHTGVKPYKCMYKDCTWAFSSSSKLKRHETTHTNIRKYHCKFVNCNKSFVRSEHLKEHTMVHVGNKPYQCQECSSSFQSKASLNIHMKRSHPGQEKACARAVPFNETSLSSDRLQSPEKLSPDLLLEQAVAIQSLEVPPDILEYLGDDELLDDENFSTVNLKDLH